MDTSIPAAGGAWPATWARPPAAPAASAPVAAPVASVAAGGAEAAADREAADGPASRARSCVPSSAGAGPPPQTDSSSEPTSVRTVQDAAPAVRRPREPDMRRTGTVDDGSGLRRPAHRVTDVQRAGAVDDGLSIAIPKSRRARISRFPASDLRQGEGCIKPLIVPEIRLSGVVGRQVARPDADPRHPRPGRDGLDVAEAVDATRGSATDC